MTVTEQDTLLSQLLGDPNDRRWKQADHRLPALNSSQRTIVMKILGFATELKSVFDLLLGIQASKTISISTSGYALSGLHSDPGRMIAEQGFMRAEVTLDGVKQRCVRYTPEKEGLSQNYYLDGDNEYPVIRFEGNSVYVDVTDGYYPVSTDLYYIREPAELVVSGASGYQVTTCELNTGLHDTVVKMAEALCRRIGDDFVQYQSIKEEVDQELLLLVQGSKGGTKSSTVGQFTREQRTQRGAE